MPDDRQLDQRKAAILSAVVQQYIETAQPVGSSTVSARTDVAVSSATVRNDMTLLERDCRNVCDWFTRRGHRADAGELFAHALGELG